MLWLVKGVDPCAVNIGNELTVIAYQKKKGNFLLPPTYIFSNPCVKNEVNVDRLKED